MKKLLLFIVPALILSACNSEKTYIVGEDAFCVGLEETSEEMVFCKDAQDKPITGIVIEHYASGKILREMHIKDGRENGIEKEFYENGNLRVVSDVLDGRANGLSKLYNEDGKLYMEMNWENGEAKDIKVYDAQGNVIATQESL